MGGTRSVKVEDKGAPSPRHSENDTATKLPLLLPIWESMTLTRLRIFLSDHRGL